MRKIHFDLLVLRQTLGLIFLKNPLNIYSRINSYRSYTKKISFRSFSLFQAWNMLQKHNTEAINQNIRLHDIRGKEGLKVYSFANQTFNNKQEIKQPQNQFLHEFAVTFIYTKKFINYKVYYTVVQKTKCPKLYYIFLN